MPKLEADRPAATLEHAPDLAVELEVEVETDVDAATDDVAPTECKPDVTPSTASCSRLSRWRCSTSA